MSERPWFVLAYCRGHWKVYTDHHIADLHILEPEYECDHGWLELDVIDTTDIAPPKRTMFYDIVDVLEGWLLEHGRVEIQIEDSGYE